MSNIISAELRRAYENTVYCVFTETGDLQFRVNDVNEKLDRLLADHAVQSAAFITAANPHSEILSDAENAQRNLQLTTELARAGFRCLRCEGRDPAGQWQAEPSLLVLGIEPAAATELARQYGQNAYVFIQVQSPATLVEV